MATNVTNRQIYDALRIIYGANLDEMLGSNPDLSGAQNSTFMSRVVSLGVDAGAFDQAKQIARSVAGERFDPGGNQINQIIQGLSNRGVSDQVIRQIVATAIQNTPRVTGGPATISQGQPGTQTYDVDPHWTPQSTAIGGGPTSAKLSVNGLLAAANQLVPDAATSVQSAFQAKAPQAIPTPGPVPGTTPPASAQSPTQEPVGPHPGVAAVTTQQAAAPKPAPVPAGPGAVGGAAGGTNRNDTPTVDNPAAWDDDKIKTFIKQNFGANAYFVDIPEVWNALKNVVKNGQGVNGLEPALEGTSFWKQNDAAARNWYVQERSDPAQAAADVAQQTQATTAMAQSMGITIDPTRASQIATQYLRYGWTQTDLQRALSAEWHYDPTSKQQAAVVSTMKGDAQNWLVPLSDQAIQSWGSSMMSGNATQDQFDQYLRDNAKSLFPQLSDMIDAHAGDKNFTLDTFVDPYRQQAANTLGISTDQINFMDPKWRQALDQIDPKTGQRRVMTLSEWDSTLKSNPQFDYDHSQNGVNDAMSLATSLKSSLGF